MWPISWRKPELTAVTAATAAARGVTAAEEHLMHLWMDRAYRLTEAHACSGTVCNAAVIVDPIRGELCDYTALRHILEHWLTLLGHIASCCIAACCIALCRHVLAFAVCRCCPLLITCPPPPRPLNQHPALFCIVNMAACACTTQTSIQAYLRYKCSPQSHGCSRLVR